jgi:hypothetical protein
MPKGYIEHAIRRATASACGTSVGSLQTGMFSPCRNAFRAECALPALLLGPGCLLLYSSGLRAFDVKSSSCRPYDHFARFDLAEFDIFDFRDRPARA